jgi:hypothetical protein
MKNCPKCGIIHEKLGIFCSRKCANSRGPRTNSFKEIVSRKLKGRKLSSDIIEKISGDNHHKRKGKNFPKLTEKECLHCKKIFLPKKQTSNYCSKTCYIEYFKIIRSEWEQYSIDCKFKFNVYDYPNYFDLQLIEHYGWYSAANKGNNLNGVSRDHMFSVKQGFLKEIPSEIISHPANCELLQHFDNNSKKTKCSITLDELYERIKNFVPLAE